MAPQSDPKLAPGQVVRPWAYGTFCLPQSEPGSKDDPPPPRTGQIWVCKLGWWTGAPWDVLAYAKQHSTYPCDSTLEQLYGADEFSAYQELGAATVLNAADLSPSRGTTSPLPAPSVPECSARGPAANGKSADPPAALQNLSGSSGGST
jgi:hypothetical protein